MSAPLAPGTRRFRGRIQLATLSGETSYTLPMLDPKRADIESSKKTTIVPDDGRPLALTAHSATASAITPKSLPHIGLKGYLRLARVMSSVFLFLLRVLVNTRGWRLRKASESELRHREGAALREKLIRLGPTFIKTGQTLATRADLLPVEYIQELAKLQDEVPPFPTDRAKA